MPLPSPLLLLASSPVSYPDAMDRMERYIQAAIQNPELFYMWFLEHPPLYTQGRSDREAHASLPFPIFKTSRGGKLTYHGPGQKVVYVITPLAYFNNDIQGYVAFLEEWVITSLRTLHLAPTRDPAGIGVWLNKNGAMHKIAAIGVKVHRGIVSHGIALNIDPDLSHFASIIPCGIRDRGVTSLADLGIHLPPKELQTLLENSFWTTYLQQYASFN